MSRPDVVVFDVNETLSDLTPMADRFADVGLPPHLATTWFASVLRDGFGLAAAGTSAPFAEIAAAVLRTLLVQHDAQDDVEGSVRHVLQGFSALSVHPDVADGVRALRSAGLRLVTLSNGAASVAEGLLDRAGLRDAFEQVLTVEDAGVWKPAPASYAHASARTGVAAGALLLVAVHPWDVDGAARAGMRSAYVDRSGAAPWPPYLPDPELRARSLVDLAEQLAAL